jgi:hypothetical protein
MAAPGFSNQNNPNPAEYAAAITVGTDFSNAFRGVYVGATGNVTVKLIDGTAVQFVGALTGSVIPVRGIGVSAATASNLVALF